jgi:hypothetical protein
MINDTEQKAFSWDEPYDRLPDDNGYEVYKQGGKKYRLKIQEPSSVDKLVTNVVKPALDKTNPFYIDFSDSIQQEEEKRAQEQMALAEQGVTHDVGVGKMLLGGAAELAGANLGMKTGAVAGSWFGPVGTILGGAAGRAIGAYTSSLAVQNWMFDGEVSHGRALLDTAMAFNPLGFIAKRAKVVNKIGSNIKTNTVQKLADKNIVTEGFANAVTGKTATNIYTGGIGGGVTGGIYSTYNQWETGEFTMGQLMQDMQSFAIFGTATSAGMKSLGKMRNVTIKEFDKAIVDPKNTFHKDANVIKNIMDGQVRETDNKIIQQASKIVLGAKIQLSDSYEYIKQLQNQSGQGNYYNKQGILKTTDDSNDAYSAFRRMPAIVLEKIRKSNIANKKILEMTSYFAGKNGLEQSVFRATINEYMISRRQLQLNKNNRVNKKGVKRDKPYSGIDDDVLKKRIKDIEELSFFGDMKPIIDLKQQYALSILDMQLKAGVLSEKAALSIQKKNSFYVPLQREMEFGKPNVLPKKPKSTVDPVTLKKTVEQPEGKLRDLDVNLKYAINDTIKKAEKNKALNVMANLLEANPNSSKVLGKVIPLKKDDRYGVDVIAGMNRKTQAGHIEFYRDGKKMAIDTSKSDIAIFKDTLEWMPGESKVPFFNAMGSMFNAMGSLAKMQAAGLTAYDPTFQFRNIIRDRQDAFIRNIKSMDIKNAFSVFNPVSLGKDMKTISKHHLIKDKKTFDKNDLDYIEFLENGGGAGGYGQDFHNDIDKMWRNINYVDGYRGNFKKNAEKIGSFVQGINSVFEQNTRFSVYKNAKAAGYSPGSAALLARDSSFDPLAGGRSKGFLATMYLFANPTIQGAKNFGRAIDPRTAKGREALFTTMSGLTALNMYQEYWNMSIDPDWETKVTGSRKGYGEWKLNNHFIFLDPNYDPTNLTEEPKMVTIPKGFNMSMLDALPNTLAKLLINPKYRDMPTGDATEMFIKRQKDRITNATMPVPADLLPTQAANFANIFGLKEKDQFNRPIKKWSPKQIDNPFLDMNSPEVLRGPSAERVTSDYQKRAIGKVFIGLADALDKTMDVFGQGDNKFTPETFEYAGKIYLRPIFHTIPKVGETAYHLFQNVAHDIPLPKDLNPEIIRAFYGTGYSTEIAKDINTFKDSVIAIEDETRLFDNQGYNNLKILEKEYREYLKNGSYNPEVDQALFDQKGKELIGNDPNLLRLWRNKKEKMDAGVGYWEGRVSKLSKARKGEILNRITETVEPERAKVIVDDLIDKKLINKTTVKISKIMKDIENSELFPQLSRSAKEKIIYDRTSRVKNVK